MITATFVLILFGTFVFIKANDNNDLVDVHEKVKKSLSYVEVNKNYELIDGKNIHIIGISFEGGNRRYPIILYENEVSSGVGLHLVEPLAIGGGGTNNYAQFETE